MVLVYIRSRLGARLGLDQVVRHAATYNHWRRTGGTAGEELQAVIPIPGRGMWAWAARPAVMGILNVTPDSFSDGGAHCDVRASSHRSAGTIVDACAVPGVEA